MGCSTRWAVVLAVLLPLSLCRAGSGSAGEGNGLVPAQPAETEAAPPAACPGQRPAPDILALESLVEIYGPVRFTHRVHTGYALKQCVRCHHKQTPGQAFVPCRSCHQRQPLQAVEQLDRPGLVGAYHRQCINCHVEMGGGPTGCSECHQPRD